MLPTWLQAKLWPSLTQCRCCSRTLFPGVPGGVGCLSLAREADVTDSLAMGTSSL